MKYIRVLSGTAALLLVASVAQAQRGRDDRRGQPDQHQQQHQDQHVQTPPQNQQRPSGNWRGGESEQRGVDRTRDDQSRADQARADQARADQARAEQARADQARAAAEQNQRRAAQQNDQWRDRQQNQARQRDQLERAQRAQQQAELERERQAQLNRAYDRDRDARLGYAYRYNIRGVYRETSQYGADVLRQAVNQGYEQGYRAGSIDRDDGAPANFQRALDFETDGFGYTGAYVPQSDYSYYFSEGFQRGYDDGYWNRSQYGTFLNGKAAILGAIALGIIGLTAIH